MDIINSAGFVITAPGYNSLGPHSKEKKNGKKIKGRKKAKSY
jgi:hypothetical protein